MGSALDEHLATMAGGIRILLGDGWSIREGRFVASDRVTLDLHTSAITFRDTNGNTSGLIVNSGSTYGTYATLCRALHNMTDATSRDAVRGQVRALRELANELAAWESVHNKP